jgi:hypothetical protein
MVSQRAEQSSARGGAGIGRFWWLRLTSVLEEKEGLLVYKAVCTGVRNRFL